MQQLITPRRHVILLQVEQSTEHREVLSAGEEFVHGCVLTSQANGASHIVRLSLHVESVDLGGATRRLQQRRQDADSGRFAGSVRPEESNDLPPRNNEVDSVQRLDVPEFLDQALGLNGIFGHRHERYARGLLSPHRAQPSSTST